MAGGLMGGGLGRRRRLLPTADINVTSLVDVAFVLLIIFMITAPMMQGGVPVELPKAEGRPLAPSEGIIVTVDRRGQIWVDQTRVSYQEFRSAFRALVARKRSSDVYVRGDRRAAYGDVVRVLAAIRASGLSLKVNVTTEDEEVAR
ncbi:MAG TPA: biopolymer transporter ExbD [Gemmatimonadales bacterium]|jgi:biopolymer transport protein TolR